MKVNWDKVYTAINIYKAKNATVLSSCLGSYKDYKESRKLYASLAVKDFDMAPKTPVISFKNIPLFSPMGRNIMKNIFLDMFRIKTKDEKIFKKMLKSQTLLEQFGKLKQQNPQNSNLSYVIDV